MVGDNSPVSIEAEVIYRNKRHLEQTTREGGVTQTKNMQEVQEDHSLSNMSAAALGGMLESRHGISVKRMATGNQDDG